jgi:Papain family cysteine protease
MDELQQTKFDTSDKIYKIYNKNILCVDLQNSRLVPDIFTQGKVPSCVIQSFVYAFKFKLNQMANKRIEYTPSRYYLYYYANFENQFGGKLLQFFGFCKKSKKGGGSRFSYLIDAINSYGMIKELPWENNYNLYLQSINCMKEPLFIDNNTDLYANKSLINSGTYYITKTNNDFFNFNSNNNESYLGIDNKYLSSSDKWKHNIELHYLSVFGNCIKNFKYHLQNHDMIMICVCLDMEQMYLYTYANYENMKSSVPQIIKPSNNFKYQNAHSMVIVGYNDQYGAFKLANSWGQGWGYDGYCWISYECFSSSIFAGNILMSAAIIKSINIC